MRILHAASDIAGVPATLARQQRALGHQAQTISYVSHLFGFQSDVSFDGWGRWSRGTKLRKALDMTLKLLPQYDVFHLTAERTLLPFQLDLPILKRLKKTVIVHFHGCDVRQVEMARGGQLVHCHQCLVRPECPLGPQLRRERMALRYADAVLCSTPDLAFAARRAYHVPNPIDLSAWSPAEKPTGSGHDPFVVAHLPSDPRLKGTQHVVDAIGALRDEGLPIELRLASGVRHEVARQLYEDADLVVDQLFFGWYGMVAVEAMALGKPVAVYLRPGVAQRHGHPPVLDATPKTIKSVLAAAVRERGNLVRLANLGRPYVERVHDAKRVAVEVLDIYREAGAGG